MTPEPLAEAIFKIRQLCSRRRVRAGVLKRRRVRRGAMSASEDDRISRARYRIEIERASRVRPPAPALEVIIICRAHSQPHQAVQIRLRLRARARDNWFPLARGLARAASRDCEFSFAPRVQRALSPKFDTMCDGTRAGSLLFDGLLFVSRTFEGSIWRARARARLLTGCCQGRARVLLMETRTLAPPSTY